MYSLVNGNHAISFVGNCIFDSNYKRALVLNIEQLNMICAPSVGEEKVAKFELVFTAVIYILLDAQLEKDKLWYMNSTTDSYPIFLEKIPNIILLRCIHIHTRKHQIYAEQGKE